MVVVALEGASHLVGWYEFSLEMAEDKIGRWRPSRTARASERLCLRTRVDTDEAVAFVAHDIRFGSGGGPMMHVREMVISARGGVGTSSSRAGRTGIDGRRGGAVEGASGRVIEGAGFGEGIERRDSREK